MKNVLILVALLGPVAVAAHPYIGIDAQVEVVLSDGQPDAVRITWTYDVDFTAILLSDIGLDSDGDGVLTQAEQAELSSYVTNWPDGFRGDVHLDDLRTAESSTYPGARSDHRAAYVDGQLIESFQVLVPPWTPLHVAIYDPSYVSAYRISEVSVRRADGVNEDGSCGARIVRADRFKAQAKLAALIAQMPEGTVELAFPAVGRDFADMVEVTCP